MNENNRLLDSTPIIANLSNIGTKEQAKRRHMGVITLAVAFALAAVLILSNAAWWVRLVIFLPLIGGFVGLFQAHEKT
ncbi:MAG: hypothetical protein D6712_09540 [Chloroflexi bacterium]|nr:MAG: hypothetical protein D6712_09540 [Chloroflexota bacterium]